MVSRRSETKQKGRTLSDGEMSYNLTKNKTLTHLWLGQILMEWWDDQLCVESRKDDITSSGQKDDDYIKTMQAYSFYTDYSF